MESKKVLKTCKKGHRFYKSSTCPSCPTCEQERQPSADFLANLGAPARRALENHGIKTLEQLASYSEAQVLAWHGIGKSSIPKLQKCLEEVNLKFSS